MSYLYAGLGIAMLTGIMAMFEMGLSLSGQSLLPHAVDPYFSSNDAAEADRALFKLLSSDDDLNLIGRNRKDTVLCAEIIKRIDERNSGKCNPSGINSSHYCPLKGIKQAKDKPVKGWGSACGLTLPPHRILILPSDVSTVPYQIYSCVLSGNESGNRCSFEEES